MREIFLLIIIVAIMMGNLTACSEQQPISPGTNTDDTMDPTQDQRDPGTDNQEMAFDSLKIDIIEDFNTLHPHLKEILEQAKTQKGYLILKGSDLPEPDTTLFFIGSGQKNTGGYDIKIKTAKKEENELNIIIEEIAPNPQDSVIQVITYPFILFSIQGDYSDCTITDIDGNQFDPVHLQGPQSPDERTDGDSSNANIKTDRKKANALVERFIAALNIEDPREILECLDSRMVGYYTTETVETALLDYKVCLEGHPIVDYKWIADHPHIPHAFIYQLVSETGATSQINVVFDEDAIWISCELLDYSYQSKHLLNRFIYALGKEDEKLLAQVLSLDDLSYSETNALEVIEKYKDNFDLESLEFQFVEIQSEQRAFLYRMIGKKDDQAVEHPLRVTFEDELIQIDDQWIPDNE